MKPSVTAAARSWRSANRRSPAGDGTHVSVASARGQDHGEGRVLKDEKPQWRSFPPFYAHLGLELEALGSGKCVIRLPYVEHFGNTRGEVHGGIVASLLDITLSQALRSSVEGVADMATISMTVSYLAPAAGVLTCRGTTVRGGRSIGFAEGEVTDEKGHAVCRAVATYRILRPRPTEKNS